MGFRDATQSFFTESFAEFFPDRFDLGGSAFGERRFDFVPEFLQARNEFRARQNGSRGDGDVTFRFGALFEDDPLPALFEGVLDERRVGELIGEGARTIGHDAEEVLNHGGVAPREKAVEIFEFTVEFVVLGGVDGDDVPAVAEELFDLFSEVERFFVTGDLFAVLDAHLHQRFGESSVNIGSGDDEWPEEVAFAAFVDAEVRLEHLGVVHLVVAELGFAEDHWFEDELDEFLRALALDQ